MKVLKEPTKDQVGYALGADDMNFILYSLNIAKSGKQEGEVRRTPIGYFSTVRACLERIKFMEVISSDLNDLEAMDNRVQATINTCIQNLGDLNFIHKHKSVGDN